MKRLAALILLISLPLLATDDYVRDLEAHRAGRLERLTRPDGWLTLIGLHYLSPGPATVGSAADNAIVLAAGPSHLGTVTLASNSSVSFEPAPGVHVTLDGARQRGQADLVVGDSTHSLVASGTVSFFVIERSGRKALRVKDSASERRKHFAGIQYFPTDPSWRITAEWMPYDPPLEIPITNVAGKVNLEKAPGKAVFHRGGQTYELTPILEGPDEPLFFIFSDATSGKETYGGMRFLYAERAKDGKVILDFNRAYNPPCAFTPFATCPLPPKENRLATLRIEAGELAYKGSHD